MTEITDSDYTAIIPTAFLTAYPRTFTDIPYSKEIFEQLVKLRKEENLPELDSSLIVPRLAPELEARYKLINKLLSDSNITQVLELASGLSARGLILTTNNPSVSYAELELPDMILIKRLILNRVATMPANLSLVLGNALRVEDMRAATEDFDSSEPVAVINEGLLRYLNFSEKAQVASNIRSLLERFGGVWITSDTTPRKFLAMQNTITQPGMNVNIAKTSGKNFENTMFEDLGHAARFFGELGFEMKSYPLSEIKDELSSASRLELSSDEIGQLLSHGVVVVMKLRS